ncbi:hypothetical protein BKA93DRAFT_812863 [Sparassis latifolia]
MISYHLCLLANAFATFVVVHVYTREARGCAHDLFISTTKSFPFIRTLSAAPGCLAPVSPLYRAGPLEHTDRALPWPSATPTSARNVVTVVPSSAAEAAVPRKRDHVLRRYSFL